MKINRNAKSLALVICFWLVKSVLSSVFLQCNEPYECNVVNESSSAVDCFGYKSCFNAIALIVHSDEYGYPKVYCGGSYSCYDANALVVGYTYSDAYVYVSSAKLNCDGYHSCTKANVFAQGRVFCDGSFSCVNSVISNYWQYYKYSTSIQYSQNSDKMSIYCEAFYSCAGAEMDQAGSVIATGSYSLYYAAIWSGGVSLNVTLSGHEAGNNLNIFCSNKSGFVSDHDVCKVICQGTGCDQTYLHCDIDEIIGNKCTYQCGYDSVCPYICSNGVCYRDNWIYNYVDGSVENSVSTITWDQDTWSSDRHVKMQTLILSGDSNDEQLCEHAENTILCDAYDVNWDDSNACFECLDSNNTINFEQSSVCCRGYFSCAYALSPNTGTSPRGSHFLCDGVRSCNNAALALSNNNINGYVNCGGFQSCASGTISGQTGTKLYCDGHASCVKSIITSFDWLQCTGDDSCFSATISDVTHIDASAEDALTSATIRVLGTKIATITLRADSAAVGLTIYVSQNASLILDCKTAQVCSDVSVECSGTCQIECNEKEGVACPYVYGNTVGLPRTTEWVDGSGQKGSSGMDTMIKWTLIGVGVVLGLGCVVAGLWLIVPRRKKEQQLQLKDMRMQASKNLKGIDGAKMPFEKLISSDD